MMTLLVVIISCLFVAFGGSTEVPEAPAVNNPPSAQYIAKTPAGGSQAIVSEIAVQGNPNGTGAWFTININGPPLTGGPFMYHIHDKPVPENGNCTATAAHMDPYTRGETPPCDPNMPATCQTGDLSGKHGTIQDLPGYSTQYVDAYVSLVPGTPSFIGGRSWVLHYANKTRIACANFVAVDGPSGSSPSGSGSAGGSAGGSTGGAVGGTTGGAAGGPSNNMTIGLGGGMTGGGMTGGGTGGATPTGPTTGTTGAGTAAGGAPAGGASSAAAPRAVDITAFGALAAAMAFAMV